MSSRKSSKQLSLPWAFAASIGWIGFFLSSFFVITLIVATIVFSLFARKAFQATGTTFSYWKDLVNTALTTQPVQTNGVKTFLLLGLDSLETRPGQPELTDSMVLLSVNLNTGSIKSLSLPRDLWLPDYQTKINALYWYGKQSENPTEYLSNIVTETTGQPIHHVIPITLDQVSSLIDAVGGVEVTVQEGFVDDQFPRSDVDVTKVHDPALLYETISFTPGPIKMDGVTALKFMRSRKASGDEGTDEARSRRQQLVLAALLSNLTHASSLSSPEKLSKVYSWYQTNYATAFPIQEAAATALALWPHRRELDLTQYQLSIYPDYPKGVIWHPPLSQTANQWAYVIRNQEEFLDEVTNKLGSGSAAVTTP